MKIPPWLRLIPALLIALAAPAAWSDSKAPLSAAPASLSMKVGDTATLKVSKARGRITAGAADPTIATASVSSKKVKVAAKAAGSTEIIIEDAKQQRFSVAVTVAASDSGGSDDGAGTTGNGGTTTPTLSVTPTTVVTGAGTTTTLQASNVSGTLKAIVANTTVASASVSGSSVKVTAKASGTTQITVKDDKSSVTISVTVTSAAALTGSYTLLAWNDLGMHCMDGDFSVFSILPPYNNLHAQLVDRTNNGIVTDGVSLTYEAMADADGSINSGSADKTNFWQYVQELYGASPAPDVGLTGNHAPGYTPYPLAPNTADGLFVADGIPITPIDDSNRRNTYPMVKVVARDAKGNELASARAVLPVSDEMSCANCHASGTGPDAKPAGGWVYDSQAERDWKRNILRLHDEKQAANGDYAGALAVMNYQAAGLEATAEAGRPILCAACHASNALPGTGVAGLPPLTEAIHSHHAAVKDPVTGLKMDDITNRSSCYQCHPGSETKCLRGVMGETTLANGTAAIDCQSCHGRMSNVGHAGRVGWLDQPNCQACHHDGKRELTAVENGSIKQWLDTRYATNPNTPAQGFSLYRMSHGHGGLQCEACHGATHAEYPSSHRNDNVLAEDVQGHAGSIGECSACHAKVPVTTTGGPHGMHTIGNAWISAHGDKAEKGASACTYCHGSDYRGGDLSEVMAPRTFNVEGRNVTFAEGKKVGCYDCHNGPKGD